MFRRSVRFKIIFSYMALLFITLSIFGALLYGIFTATLYDDLDDLLSSRAEGVADSITAYFRVQKMLTRHDALDDFTKLAEEWVSFRRKDIDLMRVSVQILDSTGKTVISSKNMPKIDQLPYEEFKEMIDEDEDDLTTRFGAVPEGKTGRYRVFTRPVKTASGDIYFVQSVAPMQLVAIALGNLIIGLGILIPFTVLIAGASGAILARVSLRPVDKMITALHNITAENLSLRIHIPDTKDEINRLGVAFNDMLDRLDRSFTSQQRFIQNIADEIRTPMLELMEELRSAQSKYASVGDCEALIDKASKELEGYSKTIEGLMVISQYEEGRLYLEIKKVDMVKVVDRVVTAIRPVADQKRIDISLDLPEKVIMDGDSRELNRLTANLLDNAIKYTKRQGSVAVSLSTVNGSAVLKVRDTGIGIPRDEVEYIFDRFYQVSGARSSRRGFGLGLSIVRQIVQEHKGAISVESDVGRGTTFSVTLPLRYTG